MLTGEILRVAASRAPQKLALSGGPRQWTYADLDADSNRFASALIARGMAAGTRVAIMSANRPEYAIFYFGTARSAHISAHISFRSSPRGSGLCAEHGSCRSDRVRGQVR